MFGELESESPRVPSPWDPFLSSPSSLPLSDLDVPSPTSGSLPSIPNSIPKLVPEADQGNVEYKLKLITPSPARFARLVTQLKWRLLEGGGQCYYELGVTDNGLLIGLSRSNLEQSLETLEMMAGEIGASVIVVKEIEVPKEMVEISEKIAARYVDFETGEVKRSKCPDLAARTDDTSTTNTTSAESDSDPSSTTDIIFPIDPVIPVRSLSTTNGATLDLEISSVYKPRPVRTPGASTCNDIHDNGKHKAHHHVGNKKPKSLPHASHVSSSNLSAASLTPDLVRGSTNIIVPNKQQRKAAWRQQAQNRRKAEKTPVHDTDGAAIASDGHLLIPALDGLHVSLDPTLATTTTPPLFVPSSRQEAKQQQPLTGDCEHKIPIEDGPRLIVEALVVRKLSLDEAFLDFAGFGFDF